MGNIAKLFDSFKVQRAADVDLNVLQSIKAPTIENIEQRNIIDTFISDKCLEDDRNGNLASFVVMSPEHLPLAFFSLRCGELFENVSMNKMRNGHNAFVSLKRLANGEIQTQEEQKKALENIKEAINSGLSIEDFEELEEKKDAWKCDNLIDGDKEINKVFKTFPAIELKLFGINEVAKQYWSTLPFSKDRRIGETLFWVKIVETIQQIQKYIGCQYLYLFAADKEAEGQLVQYYRVKLGFDYNAKMTTNKPMFDWKCQFLFQDIKDLVQRREQFISSFI